VARRIPMEEDYIAKARIGGCVRIIFRQEWFIRFFLLRRQRRPQLGNGDGGPQSGGIASPARPDIRGNIHPPEVSKQRQPNDHPALNIRRAQISPNEVKPRGPTRPHPDFRRGGFPRLCRCGGNGVAGAYIKIPVIRVQRLPLPVYKDRLRPGL
jgi:hypothetical protein